MASGSYAKKPAPREPISTSSRIPPRATRQLQAVAVEEAPEPGMVSMMRLGIGNALQSMHLAEKTTVTPRFRRVVDAVEAHPLERHAMWLRRLIICLACIVLGAAVLLSASVLQREGDPQLVNFHDGKAYDIQVGGNLLADSWQSNGPLPPKVPLPAHTGPYSVLGSPTIDVATINRVLAAYNSPAAGKGQALYDLGVKYGIDPVFALAFFQHESTFGNYGEARQSLSLGNLRCIPNYRCQDNYAWFDTWEDGFAAWYKLIRNLYVAYWGLTTVDQIIPRYAPTSDNNNEAAYIHSVEHSIDVWHAGAIMA